MVFIESLTNPRVKEVVKLREGKHRRHSRICVIDGLREIERARLSGIVLRDVFIAQSRNDLVEFVTKNFDLNQSPRISIYSVSEKCFQKMAFGDRNEGILAIAEIPNRSFSAFETMLSEKSAPLLAVLERIEKPGNIGAIFRSADGAGIDGILLIDSLCDQFNPNAIRSSIGTVFRLPTLEIPTSGIVISSESNMDSENARSDTDFHSLVSKSEIINWLMKQGIQLAVARCDAAISYVNYDFRQPTAIVLGNEASGLSDSWQGDNVFSISLPMCGIADSLNVSNAAAILFYEARRQRSEISNV
ncbi:MAG: TrmH family RNA methyltransferase [Thermoguttaceae bacterium]